MHKPSYAQGYGAWSQAPLCLIPAPDATLSRMQHSEWTIPLTDAELMSVMKPAQYIGGEFGSVKKDLLQAALTVCLAFPDTYQVGMSHLGLQILYDIVNKDSRFAAERAFVPLPDMAQLLRAKGVPLFSLESKLPLHRFDVFGVSLQYELCATSVLELLSLGHIPLHAKERNDHHPMVIGGGPFAYHPEPLSDFFDAFLIGDGEELLPRFLSLLLEVKRRGLNRAEQLNALASLEGVYVPSIYAERHDSAGRYLGLFDRNGEKAHVRRTTLATLEQAPYPLSPVVPHLRAVHDRLSMEIMRGCLRGCRFCQAGYVYRPGRERPAREVVAIADASLKNSGYEELSLLSLSSADYGCLLPLLSDLKQLTTGRSPIAISIPSSRADKMGAELLGALKHVHRSGFTLAPEAGTQRLRDVINKGLTDEELFESCRRIFELGWRSIKLYFMIGLPTETDQDVAGIVETAKRVKALGTRRTEVTVSVSTFVPKPFTPFQWAAQLDSEEVRRKHLMIKDLLRQAGIKFRYQEGFESMLEGAIGRGDRRMGKVIETAHRLGCRLDAWSEHSRPDLWLQAFQESGLDLLETLAERPLDAPLAWDHIELGIPKEWFAGEWELALAAGLTEDCLTRTCSGCGICGGNGLSNVSFSFASPASHSVAAPPDGPPAPKIRNYLQILRLHYRKSGPFRFLAHLDLIDAIFMAVRRARLPLSFSQGFNPKPNVAFGPPLQLGLESDFEFADFYLFEEIDPASFAEKLNAQLPQGLRGVSAAPISSATPSIQASIESQRFECAPLAPESGLPELVRGWETRAITRDRGTVRAQVPLSMFVNELRVESDALWFSLISGPSVPTLKPLETLHALTGGGLESFRVRKVGVSFSS